ncbi:hypothetical protein LJ707_16240 [Mucilaginibacter sp. UR6-1]|uniref:hypothetical protein n=1 Tax=Mucilaginibacter sp. UR6-1 TaxID=1435643 RepID=UPI001E384B2D|nr:hypothetical protein [Mucilaginibacter sp. UR6-1]MCC8410493.1 hypothetical protein [Mucilaginibacter sp. UR6-1]
MKTPQLTAYNKAVRDSYALILKQARQMLGAIEQEELRFILEREDKSAKIETIIHELINPLLYLRLEHHSDDNYAIHFGFEQVSNSVELSSITTQFTRILYKQTSKDFTTVDIEGCVRTDWFINSPSAMYEYIEERGLKHHTFKQLPYKPKAAKRKLKAVA